MGVGTKRIKRVVWFVSNCLFEEDVLFLLRLALHHLAVWSRHVTAQFSLAPPHMPLCSQDWCQPTESAACSTSPPLSACLSSCYQPISLSEWLAYTSARSWPVHLTLSPKPGSPPAAHVACAALGLYCRYSLAGKRKWAGRCCCD